MLAGCPLQEGCGGFGQCAGVVYQNDPWDRGYVLQGEVGLTWVSFFGMLEVVGRVNRSTDDYEEHRWGRQAEALSNTRSNSFQVRGAKLKEMCRASLCLHRG